MAQFIGTNREYHDFIGPRIRNVVQRITLTEKKKCNNVCAHCKKENVELESAHIHGNERKRIVENILSKYKIDSHFEIDIGKVENEIIQAHYPISKNFYFLCRSCHKIYDSKYSEDEIYDEVKNEDTKLIINKQKQKLEILNDIDIEVEKIRNKLPKWFRNKNQYNSKIMYAFLKLYENNEKVNYDVLKNEANIETFKSNFDQMKNIQKKNHGKIFEQEGDYVYLWENVKELVLNYYKKYKNEEF